MDSSIRSIIDRIWTNFWEGGVTNPLTVIEQITYLLFVKGLDDIEIAHEKNDVLLGIKSKRIFDDEHQNCRWSSFKDYPAEKMFKIMSEEVFPFIKNLANDKNSGYAKYMEDAIFIIPTPIMLQKVVTAMDKLEMKDRDTKGDVYEYLLSKLSQAGVNGQFRTPRHIIKMIVELMRPTPEDIIVDPACGTAGFLVEAGEFLRKNKSDLFLSGNLTEHFNNTMFYGFDMDRTIMIFTKTTQGGTDKVWFYDMTADGFSLDDQRQPVKENDIPDIINRFNHRDSEEEQNRKRTEKSFCVPKEEIVENDYDLSINKYKEIVVEKKEYEKPEVILKRMIDMEAEIQQKLKELEGLI